MFNTICFQQPEPASRRALAVSGGRMGPLPSIPRPSTALGTPRMTQAPLIESSESEDTEPSGGGHRRPRSSSSVLVTNIFQSNIFFRFPTQKYFIFVILL